MYPRGESGPTPQIGLDPETPSVSLGRSILFYPALSPERWDEAMEFGADKIVFDLEDGRQMPSTARRYGARTKVVSRGF